MASRTLLLYDDDDDRSKEKGRHEVKSLEVTRPLTYLRHCPVSWYAAVSRTVGTGEGGWVGAGEGGCGRV